MITMYQASVPLMDHMLTNLSKLLDKAIAHAASLNYSPDVLLGTRLFPDMFPLIKQIQIVCDFAKGAGARLSGVEVPTFADEESTMEEAKERIAKTLAFIRGLDASTFEQSAERTIELKMRGEVMTMDGQTYLYRFVMPNFYFHSTTAYNLLRHNGVPVGKRDFMGV